MNNRLIFSIFTDLAGLNWSRFNVNLGPKVGGQNGKKEIFS